jgi:hypothetical protein
MLSSPRKRVTDNLSFPKIPSAGFLVEDLASIVKRGIFIVDDVALPPPITFLVLRERLMIPFKTQRALALMHCL